MHIGVQSGATTTELGYARAYSLYKAAGFDSVDMNLNNKLKNETAFRAGDFDKTDCIFDHPMEEILAHFAPEFAELKINGLVSGQAQAPFPTSVPRKP